MQTTNKDKRNRTIVILPALNEAVTIAQTIRDVRENGGPCDIVVVNGPSTDGTGDIARMEGATVLSAPRGKGRAVRSAFRRLSVEDDHDFWVMMDSDYTYPGVAVKSVVEELARGRDAVIGWRWAMDDGAMSRVHRLGNAGLSWIARTLYGYNIRDVCTGMWGFTREAVERMRLSSDGFTLEADLFSNVVRSGCRIGQVKIGYRARPDGSQAHLKLRDGLTIAWMLLRKSRVRWEPEREELEVFGDGEVLEEGGTVGGGYGRRVS